MKTTLIIATCAFMFASCIPDSGRHTNHYYGIDEDEYEYQPVEVEPAEVAASDDNEYYQQEFDTLLDDFERVLERVATRTHEVYSADLMTRDVDRLNELYTKISNRYDRSRTTYAQDERYEKLCNRLDEVADIYNRKFGFDTDSYSAPTDSAAYYY